MSHDFYGVGWGFPVNLAGAPEPGVSGVDVRMAHYEQAIRESIWIILSTARGERMMRPDFGCGIHNLIFALESASTIGWVQHEVEQALLFWEPRISVLRVDVRSENRRSSSATARNVNEIPGDVERPVTVSGGLAGPVDADIAARRHQGSDTFDGAVLLIEIEYVVKANNSRFNLVYPFYLERTQRL